MKVKEFKKPKYTGANINSKIDDDDEVSIRATVVYGQILENDYHENIAVDVVFFGTDLTIAEIEKQSIERANEIVKSIASMIE